MCCEWMVIGRSGGVGGGSFCVCVCVGAWRRCAWLVGRSTPCGVAGEEDGERVCCAMHTCTSRSLTPSPPFTRELLLLVRASPPNIHPHAPNPPLPPPPKQGRGTCRAPPQPQHANKPTRASASGAARRPPTSALSSASCGGSAPPLPPPAASSAADRRAKSFAAASFSGAARTRSKVPKGSATERGTFCL